MINENEEVKCGVGMLDVIYRALTENYLAAGEDACCTASDLLSMLSWINLVKAKPTVLLD